MSFLKRKAIVTPLHIDVVPKENKVNKDKTGIIKQMKILICLEVLLGISRLNLLDNSKIKMWIFNIWTISLVITAIYFMLNRDALTSSSIVIKNTACVEYILLITISMFSSKKKMNNLFYNLETFDGMLNIKDVVEITCSSFRGIFWIACSIIYSIVEYVLIMMYIFTELDLTVTFMYFVLIAHDTEQIFFCTLLRTILTRLRIVKAHIVKTFNAETCEEFDKVEELSKKIKLDVRSLHKVYELLHKCADQLNSIMSSPLMVTLVASGLSTIMLMNNMFKVVQMNNKNLLYFEYMLLYACIRCVKYTALVIIPCYYSSVTYSQVATIRTVLHDALNSRKLDSTERRQLKALFYLTRDSEFSYALWGVIRLNMSLPLSYISLCTTYLVIVIQFSKFID